MAQKADDTAARVAELKKLAERAPQLREELAKAQEAEEMLAEIRDVLKSGAEATPRRRRR